MSLHTVPAPSLEPIAVIGLGCRFPGGAHDPAAYLRFLTEGADGVVDQPGDRWSTELHQDDGGPPGRTQVRRGGFLHQDLFEFEPAFFGISPREAGTLDPQQRLLLEVAWEAFEDAGLAGAPLAGSRTGVFVGGFTLDAMLARFSATNQDAIDNHTATSSSMTLLSNRLSYVFDLRGPSMTVDTACSSSLVALHLACEALRREECSLALAGGVNVMLLPYYPIVMSKGHFLAPDGRSKTFEADADGYGRGEGAGLVVLKRLSQALADGDAIHAVIRGTGVNQDGATDGIPMPNPDAQRLLVEETCRRAGVDPRTVGYVEAHGTGTRAGDIAETSALGGTYGRGRTAPLAVGSVKASIGHLEAAAGVAGLIKAILSVRERRIFPHRKLRTPNPEIPFSSLNLRVPQAPEAWPTSGPARAAVNSFGYGGTNAHAIVEEAPPVPRERTSDREQSPRRSRAAERSQCAGEGLGEGQSFASDVRHAPRPGPQLLPLAARSGAGLAATAGALATLSAEASDLAGALAHRRSHVGTRAAIVAGDAEEGQAALRALAEGTRHPALLGPANPAGGRVWVYTGMGPQWWGMARELYRSEPVFAAALDEVDGLFRARAGWSILAALLAPEAESRMATNLVAQPSNLLVQVGLTRLLRAWGGEPDAILGHSVGEVAAAWAAGCLSLEDAVTVSVHRSRLQQRAAGKGGMLAVGLGREAAHTLIGSHEAVIAADNAPDLVTLAGAHEALAAIAAEAEAQGVFARPVRVEVPYHSPAMEPIREEMLASLADLSPMAPAIPLYSTLTGARVTGPVHDATYWWRNTREAVALRDATRTALADGHRVFWEVGPHPVLGPSIQSTARAGGHSVTTLHTLKRGEPEVRGVLAALGTAWTLGHAVRWDVVAPEGAPVALPLTPWQRSRHWDETRAARAVRLGEPGAHPLLARREAGPGDAWVTRLAGRRLGWLREHVVDGSAVMPGAATVEACLAAALKRGQDALVEDVRFEAALVVPEGAAVDLRVAVREDGRAEVHGRVGEADWARHATARLTPGARYRAPAAVDLGGLRARFTDTLDIPTFYAGLEARGLRYGPAFRGVRKLWRSGDEVLAELVVETDTEGWGTHAALLDSAFQCMVAIAEPEPGVTVLPIGIRRARGFGAVGPAAWVHGRLDRTEAGAWEGDLVVLTAEGQVRAEVRGLRCEAVLRRAEGRDWAHVARWIEVEAGELTSGTVLGEGAVANALRGVAPTGEAVILAAETTDPVGTEACLALLDGLRRAEDLGARRTLVVTRGGVATRPGEAVNPGVAALHGLVRVAMNERPSLGIRLVDVDELDAASLGLALRAQDEEVAVRDGALYARRITRADTLPAPRPAASVKAGAAPMALEVGQPGRLDSLGYRAVPRPAPRAGEVEIEVEAASVNFKDVMKAMGMLGDAALENAYLGRGLGLEAAGRVTRVGEGVDTVSVGDPVFTYVGGALRSHARVDARFVVRRPPGMDAATGASMFVFLTAWYALVHAGRVQAGETVLIHSAAGGVGAAALQIARLMGAEVLATAGTEDKRAWLRAQGVTHVFDSRTLDFVDEVRAATGGRGVDVVLNSLAGPALVASLGLVAPGGRFLELGKQDLAADRAVGLRPFNRSIALMAIDLDRMATERPAWFRPVAEEVAAAFADGRLTPLPARVFPADRVTDAFRALSSGELVGKAVVAMREGRVELAPARAAALGAGTWLVTGGLGGFGLRTAAWLVSRGVRDVVLAGRRGEVEDLATVAQMRAAGATVRAVALDVTDAAAVDALVAGLPSLRGVAHAAMVLADGPIETLDGATLRTAMGAKARGAWNLHRATADRDLDHFLLFGSISAQVGNPGQAAYAAANAALDGLAWTRAAACLPATCVSFGALGEAGVVARDAGTRAHLQSLGLSPMGPRAVFTRLEEVLMSASPVVTLVDIDWDRWARAVPGVGWKRLDGLLGAAQGGEGALAALPPAERAAAVTRLVREAAAAVFRMDPAAIDPEKSLRDQGLDSILAVELAVGLGPKVGLELSAMDLLAGRGVDSLAAELVRRLGLNEVQAAPEASLAERICVTRPYFALTDVRVEGDRVLATVVPDAFGGERSPVAAGEVGRHLAILGSLAGANAWPKPGRHAWPVATSTVTVEPGAAAAPGTAFRLEARCLSVDPVRGRAEAEGVMRALDGRVVGRLQVGYHVLPYDGFVAMFAAHHAATTETAHEAAGTSPYREAPVRPEGSWDGLRFTRRLPPLAVDACAGHFAGLPAMPVSILGRHVLGAVVDGMAAAGLPTEGVTVRRADLVTERFAWAGEEVELVAEPQGDGTWTCTVRVPAAEATVARFVLTIDAEDEASAAAK